MASRFGALGGGFHSAAATGVKTTSSEEPTSATEITEKDCVLLGGLGVLGG